MDSFSIDFYNNSVASVNINSSADDVYEEDKPRWLYIIDLMLFSCYTLRNFKNNINHPSSIALANILTKWNPPAGIKTDDCEEMRKKKIKAWPNHVFLESASKFELMFGFAQSKYCEPIWLSENRGNGNKRLMGLLMIVSDNWKFILNYKGFNFFGSDLVSMTNDAVLIYLCYLIKKYGNNPKCMSSISKIAKGCSGIFFENKITMTNQENLAWELVKQYSREF